MSRPVSIFPTTIGTTVFAVSSSVPLSLLVGGTLWSRGDDYVQGLIDPNVAMRWNNKYTSNNFHLSQANDAYAPIVITNPFPGVQFGLSPNLNDFLDNNLKTVSIVNNNIWHVFTVVNFNQITANDGDYYNHLVIAHRDAGVGDNSGWALSIRDNNGTKVAQGYFSSSFGVSLVTSSYTGGMALIEWFGDGSTMGIRVNNSSYMTSSIQGGFDGWNSGTDRVSVGSKAYEGGWDTDANSLFEVCTANTHQASSAVRNLRRYFDARYSLGLVS